MLLKFDTHKSLKNIYPFSLYSCPFYATPSIFSDNPENIFMFSEKLGDPCRVDP